MADTLEVPDDEESAGELGSVLDESDRSLASPLDNEKCPRCCWHRFRSVLKGVS